MPKFQLDRTMLIYGFSGKGKSRSLKNLPMEKTAMINAEGKPPSFKGANRLAAYYEPRSLDEVQTAIKECNDNPDVEYVIFDSITMLADKLMFPEFIENAPLNIKGKPDTQAGWGLYKLFFNKMIDYCKKSEKGFIFISLAMEVKDEKEFTTRIVPKIQGSLKESIASEFTTVMYADTVKKGTELEYVFVTNKDVSTMNTEAKSPEDMISELRIENDVMIVQDAITKFYGE